MRETRTDFLSLCSNDLFTLTKRLCKLQETLIMRELKRMKYFNILLVKFENMKVLLKKTVAGLTPVSLTGDILSLLSLSSFAVDLVCV